MSTLIGLHSLDRDPIYPCLFLSPLMAPQNVPLMWRKNLTGGYGVWGEIPIDQLGFHRTLVCSYTETCYGLWVMLFCACWCILRMGFWWLISSVFNTRGPLFHEFTPFVALEFPTPRKWLKHANFFPTFILEKSAALPILFSPISFDPKKSPNRLSLVSSVPLPFASATFFFLSSELSWWDFELSSWTKHVNLIANQNYL